MTDDTSTNSFFDLPQEDNDREYPIEEKRPDPLKLPEEVLIKAIVTILQECSMQRCQKKLLLKRLRAHLGVRTSKGPLKEFNKKITTALATLSRRQIIVQWTTQTNHNKKVRLGDQFEGRYTKLLKDLQARQDSHLHDTQHIPKTLEPELAQFFDDCSTDVPDLDDDIDVLDVLVEGDAPVLHTPIDHETDRQQHPSKGSSSLKDIGDELCRRNGISVVVQFGELSFEVPGTHNVTVTVESLTADSSAHTITIKSRLDYKRTATEPLLRMVSALSCDICLCIEDHGNSPSFVLKRSIELHRYSLNEAVGIVEIVSRVVRDAARMVSMS